VQGSREEWMHVFFICSGFYVFSTIVYAVLASGVEQPWAKSTDAKAAESKLELEINVTNDTNKSNTEPHANTCI